ncbi:hypothetical protein B5M09_002702 [Aphanomyces astaci]|uniref:Uncharacterized protein n=1 Tax=Aphanomyces astaci TaxID=112090 RepID=A0A3R7YTJ4_APHAT|nr:hypothetical protein B5M09_002702 [Aphanomyces astaci]
MLCPGVLINAKGMSSFWGSVDTPVAMTEYAAFVKLLGYLMDTDSPKNTPSPGHSSWSGAFNVWLLPTLAP